MPLAVWKARTHLPTFLLLLLHPAKSVPDASPVIAAKNEGHQRLRYAAGDKQMYRRRMSGDADWANGVNAAIFMPPWVH